MMNQEVRKIMTKDPVYVSPKQSLKEVGEMMLRLKIQQLPVVKEGKLLGLITSYDLWKENTTLDSERQGSEIMNKNVLTICPKDKVGTAAQLFADRRFKTLPVVNLRNELKGVVTAFDVIRQAYLHEFPKPILYKKEFLKTAMS